MNDLNTLLDVARTRSYPESADAIDSLLDAGAIDSCSLLEVLRTWLTADELLLRDRALELAMDRRLQELAPDIASVLLRDGSEIVRSSAAEALGVVAPDEQSAALVAALHDDEGCVRSFAAAALGGATSSNVQRVLEQFIADAQDPSEKANAYVALLRLGAEQHLPSLHALLPSVVCDDLSLTRVMNALRELSPTSGASERVREAIVVQVEELRRTAAPLRVGEFDETLRRLRGADTS